MTKAQKILARFNEVHGDFGDDILPDWIGHYGHDSGVTSRYQLQSHGFLDKHINNAIESGFLRPSPHTNAILLFDPNHLDNYSDYRSKGRHF